MKSCNDLVSTAVSEMSEDSEHEQQSSMCQHSEDYLGQIIVYWLVLVGGRKAKSCSH